MCDNSIVRQDVWFPGRGIGSQVLIEAVIGIAQYFKEVEDILCFEFWSSRRWINGHQSFRLGLRDPRKGFRLNYDILIVPNDGKAQEWFKTDDLIFGVEVCTRQSVDDLANPLRDLSDEETELVTLIGIVAAKLEASVKEILGDEG